MRVWIFNPFDDLPGEGKPQRFWSLAETLAAQGHEVVWWSSDWSHRRKARRQVAGDRGQAAEKRGTKSGVQRWGRRATDRNRRDLLCSVPFRLRLIHAPPYRKNISLARVWNHWRWGRRLYRDAVRAVDSGDLEKPDVILASLPPMEGPIAALRLRQNFGCKVITDVMDAWPETLRQALSRRPGSGSKGSDAGSKSGVFLSNLAHLALWPYGRMLRRACRVSDAISAQSRAFADFADRARDAGREARKDIHVCYLGADDWGGGRETEGVGPRSGGRNLDSDATVAPDQFVADKSSSFNLRLLYLGAMGRSYDLETLVEACGRLLEEGVPLELHFAGEGEKLERLRCLTENWSAGRVHFHGFLQAPALNELLRESNVGVVPMFPESGVSVPYKVGDYLSAGLPVINSLPGELSQLLETNRCGVFYEAGSAVSLEAALRHCQKKTASERAAEKARARTLFEKHFNRETTYPAFAEWIVRSRHQ